ncbi:MAG: sigma-70 family RNA polymerase sigma factor [Myxococcales bacterium]|nr:sigma-70 family RNA polymerase sigma factor [Myxococcales bacterium]MCB9525382.1 sigma-70 family RNA polymerase sigma factor [Myxococcales bacterium]
MDEKQLIRRLKRRDERAFTALVVQHQGQIYNLCFRMLGNAAEAEDVAQDTFVKAFKAIDRFRGDSQIGTWLYRIAINLCKNRLKYLGRRGRGRTQDVADVPEQAWGERPPTVGDALPRPDRVLEGRQAERRIQAALDALDPEFRELLVLRDVQSLSYAEMVHITGLAEGTVKSRLHRARNALRRAYEALGGELSE